MKAYLGMYNYYLRAVATRLAEAYRDAPKEAWSGFLSLMKLTLLDIGLCSRHKAADPGAEPAVCRPDQRDAFLVRNVDDGIVWNIDPHAIDLLAVPGSLIGADVDRLAAVVMRGIVRCSPIDIAEMHGFRAAYQTASIGA